MRILTSQGKEKGRYLRWNGYGGVGLASLPMMGVVDNRECGHVEHGGLSSSGVRDRSVTPLGGSLADLVTNVQL